MACFVQFSLFGSALQVFVNVIMFMIIYNRAEVIILSALSFRFLVALKGNLVGCIAESVFTAEMI